MSLWLRNKQQYIDCYIHNKPVFETIQMRFGSYFAREYERGFSENPMVDMALSIIPHPQHKEHKLSNMLGEVKIFGKPDGYDGETYIVECKTGVEGWDQHRADNHGQIDFYGALVGKAITADLVWLQTRNRGGRIELTGNVQIIRTVRTARQISEFEKKILVVAHEINKWEKYAKKVIKI